MGEGSTCGISTLPYPPKISHFVGDKPCPEDLVDRTQDIAEINRRVILINDTGNDSATTKRSPRLHTWGMKVKFNLPNPPIPFGRGLEMMNAHRENQWREANREDQLHFNNATRLRIGITMIRYFLNAYGIVQDNGRNWEGKDWALHHHVHVMDQDEEVAGEEKAHDEAVNNGGIEIEAKAEDDADQIMENIQNILDEVSYRGEKEKSGGVPEQNPADV